jgi:serine/threonine protein kinase
MDLSNTTVGKYDVLEQIGQGSMGTVYRGYDPFQSREVAIKVANREGSELKRGINPRKLFFNEAKISGRLKHPSIVAIYDAGVENDIWYIVMEYVAGGSTLQAHCQPNTLLSVEDVIRLVFTCAVALDYAHRKGVVHRDIKPRNILLTPHGEVKLADFGVAMITQFDATETQLQGYVGSPLYMSPEQISEDGVTLRSDLFSLGVVMYELLTGKNPFTADSLPSIIHNISNEVQVPLRQLRSDVPRILEHILDRTLKKRPEERYHSGLDLAGDLSLVFDALSLPKQEVSVRERFERVRDLRFFAEFNETELWEVVNACHWHEFSQGESIIKEGDVDSSFFVIVKGDVAVRKGPLVVDLLAQGDCFGEMGFIGGTKRSATITASSPVSVMQVRASLIERASLPCQLRFHKVFLHTLVGRLSNTTNQIVSSATSDDPDYHPGTSA